jgi:hypothetical protein
MCIHATGRRYLLDWLLRRSQRDQHDTYDCERNNCRQFPAFDQIPVFLRTAACARFAHPRRRSGCGSPLGSARQQQ